MAENQYPIQLSSHSELTKSARQSLENNWGKGVLITFVFILISTAVSIVPFGGLLVGGPLSIGMAIFAINISRNEYADVSQLFIKTDRLLFAIATYLLYILFVFLGTLCLIIPGIILGLGFSQTFFILAEDDEIQPIDALKKSWAMMDGHKADYFLFSLRFLPWAILCIFTLFIGYLWLMPYIQVSMAKYYLELSGSMEASSDDFDAIDHLIEY